MHWLLISRHLPEKGFVEDLEEIARIEPFFEQNGRMDVEEFSSVRRRTCTLLNVDQQQCDL